MICLRMSINFHGTTVKGIQHQHNSYHTGLLFQRDCLPSAMNSIRWRYRELSLAHGLGRAYTTILFKILLAMKWHFSLDSSHVWKTQDSSVWAVKWKTPVNQWEHLYSEHTLTNASTHSRKRWSCSSFWLSTHQWQHRMKIEYPERENKWDVCVCVRFTSCLCCLSHQLKPPTQRAVWLAKVVNK